MNAQGRDFSRILRYDTGTSVPSTFHLGVCRFFLYTKGVISQSPGFASFRAYPFQERQEVFLGMLVLEYGLAIVRRD